MSTIIKEKTYKSRLSAKLLVLFGLVFFGVLAAGLVMDIFGNLVDGQQNRAAVENQPPATIIDPKLETELAKVMTLENPQISADLKDPFLDRTGISQSKGVPIGSAVRVSTPTAGGSTAPTTAAVPPPNKTTIVPGKTVTGGNPTNTAAVQVIKDETEKRLQDRQIDIRQGLPVGDVSEAFDIEYLMPVGMVSGGNGKDEILFCSETLKQTFSFPVGTRFFNGSLTGTNADGVVFYYGSALGYRTRSWMRSFDTKSCGNSAEVNSPNQSGTTGGN